MRYSAKKAIWISALAAGLAVGVYLFWFVGVHELALSTSTKDWGQFGSYMAGTAGVSFALATVWMLAETIKLQRDELKLSREELRKSSEALETQVELSTHSMKMERRYYLIKTIDQNIQIICDQSIDNQDDKAQIWKYANSDGNIPKNQMQIKSIVDQYMLLVKLIEETRGEERREITELATPITYKYKQILSKAKDSSYFDLFERNLSRRAERYIHYAIHGISLERAEH